MEGHTHHHFLPDWLLVVIIVFASLFGTLALGFVLAPTVLRLSIEHYLRVPAKVGGITFEWDCFHINDLVIKNPEGFDTENAISIKQITFEAPLLRYFFTSLVVDEVKIEDMTISLLFTDKSDTLGNWTTLFQNLTNEKTKTKHGRSITIKKILLLDTKIILKLTGEQQQTLEPIKRVELDDIGTEEGVPDAEITAIIVKQVIKSLSAAEGIENMIDGILGGPAGLIKGLIDPFSGVWGGSSDSGQEQVETTP